MKKQHLRRWSILSLTIIFLFLWIAVGWAEDTYTVSPTSWTNFSDGHGGSFSYKGDKQSDRVVVRVAGNNGGNFATKRNVEIVFNNTVYGNFTVRNGDGPVTKPIGYSTLYSSSETGTKTVYVKLYSANTGALYKTKNVTVTKAETKQDPVISDFDASPLSGEAPLAVTFSVDARDPDGGSISLYFDYGDGSGGSSTSHTYTNAGRYSVTVTVTDDEGDTASSQRAIDVSAPPPVDNSPEFLTSGSVSPSSDLIGTSFTYEVRAKDIDGDDITASVNIIKPDGSQTGWYTMSYISGASSVEALFRYTKTWNTVGDYQYQFKIVANGQTVQSPSSRSGPTVTQNPPSTPTISSSPSSATINATVNISVTSGIDPDGDQVKVQCTATNSNRTQSSPYVSSLSNGGQTAIADFVFNTLGDQTIYCATSDSRGGESSNVSRSIFVSPPDPPAGLSHSNITSNSARLSWNSVNGATGYRYMISTSNSFPEVDNCNPSTCLTKPATNSPWSIDTWLAPGTTYFWRVRAGAPEFSTEWSSTASFTTDAPPEFLTSGSVSPTSDITNSIFTYEIRAKDIDGDDISMSVNFTRPDGSQTGWNTMSYISGVSSVEALFRYTKTWSTAGDYQYVFKMVANGYTLSGQTQNGPNVLLPPRPPSQPTISSTPADAEVNSTVNISVTSGIDPDGDQVKVECTATNSNWPEGSPYISSESSGGSAATASFVFNTIGIQTIFCTTFDSGGKESPTVQRNITIVDTKKPIAILSGIPTNATVGDQFTIIINASDNNGLQEIRLHVANTFGDIQYDSLWDNIDKKTDTHTQLVNTGNWPSGTVYITVWVVDQANNAAEKVRRTIDLAAANLPPHPIEPPPSLDETTEPGSDQSTPVSTEESALKDEIQVENKVATASTQDPVNTAFGNYYYRHTDIIAPAIGDDLIFTRSYDTLIIAEETTLGLSWRHNWLSSISVAGDGTVKVYRETGQEEHYLPDRLENGTQYYLPVLASNKNTLIRNTNGDYVLTTEGNHKYLFATVSTDGVSHANVLTKWINRDGREIRLTYGRHGVTVVTSPVWSTQQINLQYDNDGRLNQVTGPGGQAVTFTHDDAGNLITATDALNQSTTFEYDSDHLMIKATDPDNIIFLRNIYDDQDRVIQQYDGEVNTSYFTYTNTATGTKTTVTKRDGQAESYEYDQKYRLIAFTDPIGSTWSYTYDTAGNRTSVTDPRGFVTLYNYDTSNKPTKVTDPFGHETSFTFSGVDLISQTDALGNPTAYTYNGEGHLLSVTDPLGNTIQNTYSATGLLESTTDANNKTISFSYDTYGNRISATDPLGNVTGWEYNTAGKATAKINPLGNRFTYSYDVLGQLISITDPENNVRRFEYNSNGKVKKQIDASNESVTFAYDNNDRLTATAHTTSSRTMQTEYDAEDRPIKKIEPGGRITITEYDVAGRPIKIIDALDKFSTFSYDVSGNLIAETNPLGQTTRHSYDSLNRRMWTADPLGNYTYFFYDALGRIIKTVDGEGRTIEERIYDEVGNLIQTKDGQGNITTFAHDAVGNMIQKTDALGQITTYEYDANSNLIRTRDPLGNVSTQSYDAAGRRISMTDANGNTTAFAYDGNGNVASETDPLSKTSYYQYDVRGLLSRFTNRRNQAIQYQYNSDRLLETIIYPEKTVNYTHNDAGEVTEITDSQSTISYSYDALGHAQSRTDPYDYQIGYGYDAAGNLASIQYPGGQTVHYTYDDAGQLQAVKDWSDRQTSYSYDRGGLLINTTKPDGSVATLGYDDAQRLISLNNSKAQETIASYDYTLNGIGQRVNVRAVEQSFPFPPAADMSFTYGLANQQVSAGGMGQEFDTDGNLKRGYLGGLAADFSFDSRNQLTAGAGLQYRYDAEGYRIAAGGTRYVVDPMGALSRVLEERDNSGNVIARYVYGLGLISREDANGANFRVYHFDLRGSTVALTDGSGVVTDAYAYDPFGALVEASGGTANPFRYNGRDGVMTDSNGLYFMRARYFNPAVNRFIGQDVLLGDILEGQSLNRYAFVTNNPVSLIDPMGLSGGKDYDVSLLDAANFSAGLGDALLLGFGDNLRDFIGMEGQINKCSDAYKYGGWSAFAAGIARLSYTLLAKGASIYASSGAAASSFRNSLKNVFRLGIGEGWRKPNLAMYIDDEALRLAAGRTNLPMSVYGAGVAAAGATGGEDCKN